MLKPIEILDWRDDPIASLPLSHANIMHLACLTLCLSPDIEDVGKRFRYSLRFGDEKSSLCSSDRRRKEDFGVVMTRFIDLLSEVRLDYPQMRNFLNHQSVRSYISQEYMDMSVVTNTDIKGIIYSTPKYSWQKRTRLID